MGKVEIHGIIASSFVRTVMIVCENIGLPYELKVLDPAKKSLDFKEFNPQQTIPVLVDDGLVLQESNAIVRYLMDRYAKNDSLYPKDLKSRAVINARLDFGCGTLFPKIASVIRPVLVKGDNKIPKEGIQTLKDTISVVEQFLTRNKWIAGPEMTIADISLASRLLILLEFQIDFSLFPKTKDWLQEIKNNESFNKIHEEGIRSWRERKFGKKN